MSANGIGSEQVQRFAEDGYLILEELIDPEVVELALRIAKEDPSLVAEIKDNKNYEGEGGMDTRLIYRAELTDDVFGALARSARIVEPLEQLFDDAASHYYTLNMRKDPNTGGWQWHQDYGYHYQEFFYPNFISVMVALDPANRDNGCLRVVRGSNRIGRLNHAKFGSQLQADPERVEIALREMDEVHCEMPAGSVLYFHGNTLHASDPNLSSQGRWSMIYAYAGSSNPCVKPGVQEKLTRVEKLDDEGLRAAAQRHWEEANEAGEET
ncbi:MAG: phytanoyl-CoA dioxygenase family protein [Gemmatimonadetes bacterium]|jgi:ectoine hydroxylase-related dioxygenase (phytanoyl-CoA dioxygenase family)|nr:phytanoyl-CoA dioxygenase family protein [Gemmatimonadota bacterium]